MAVVASTLVQHRGRTQSGMAGEGQFLFHREDARLIGAGPSGWHQEDRFELAELARQPLHEGAVQRSFGDHYRKPVAGQRRFGEYVYLAIFEGAHPRPIAAVLEWTKAPRLGCRSVPLRLPRRGARIPCPDSRACLSAGSQPAPAGRGADH